MKTPTLQDRFRGCLVGLAVGDALGWQTAGWPRIKCPVRRPWQGEGRNTAAAVALATSLADSGGFDPAYAACGGCLVRFAPVALFAYPLPRDERLRLAAESCRLTHDHVLCDEAAQVLGETLHAILSDDFDGGHEFITRPELIAMRDRKAFNDAGDRRILPTHHVVDTLEAAMWAARHRPADAAHDDGPFAAGVLRATNLGGDADTVGAVAGQVLGARHGYDAIPLRWRAKLDRHDELRDLADRLHHHATGPHPLHAVELGEAGA